MKLIVAGRREEEKPSSCLLPGIIVVTVILILGAIVFPSFIKYNGPRDQQLEAKTNLGAVFTSQSYYFADYGIYAGDRNCFDILGWAPESDTKYSYFCGENVIRCTKPYCTDCGGIEALSLEPVSTISGFTVYAIGNVDRDSTDCDVWSISDDKVRRNVNNDLDNGWWRR